MPTPELPSVLVYFTEREDGTREPWALPIDHEHEGDLEEYTPVLKWAEADCERELLAADLTASQAECERLREAIEDAVLNLRNEFKHPDARLMNSVADALQAALTPGPSHE